MKKTVIISVQKENRTKIMCKTLPIFSKLLIMQGRSEVGEWLCFPGQVSYSCTLYTFFNMNIN